MDNANAPARRELKSHGSATDQLDRMRDDLLDFERRFDLMLEAKLQRFRAELLSGFGTMLFVSQAVVIAAVGLLLIAFD
jgi:hypothetical protein